MIKCIIIDDERPAIRLIKKYIERIPTLQLIGETTNPITGIEMVKTEKPDLVFLDIQMDEMNGIDVMKIIGKEALVIFCTAYSEFAVTSYELHAIDYLMKPIDFNRFVRAVQRVADTMAARPTLYEDAIPNDYIFVKAGQKGKMLKIDIDDIDIVEAKNNYVAFHCNGKKTMAYLTLKELEERLPTSQFMRVHKSYIVALKQISLMENNELVLKKGGLRVPIGASYKELFLERMKSKLMS
ncbi:LytR/AlgR family response regulator transcription factor [Terrimonas alba]|uniref:LytR/AlgR family response regulator transcription factor n=1 Tax=Terrimonas alba TaxID=3349636 RepID=UPI0035F402DB